MILDQMFNKFYSIIKFIYLVIVTLPRDLSGILLMFKLEYKFKKWEDECLTVAKLFKKLVKKHPNKPCFICDEKVWTYQEVEDYANCIANIFSKEYKLKKGDVIAIFMENRPEYICIWLGLSKIGVITALQNTNLKGQALIHSITVANSKIVIYGTELSASIEQIKSQLNSEIKLISQGPTNNSSKDKSLESSFTSETLVNFIESEIVLPKDVLMYIYTSGTTGLPKPAIIKHNRYFSGSVAFFRAAKLNENDVMYITLPLYHANGGIIGTGAALVPGATVVLRKKFSATNFWKDAIQYKCTAMMYVGEVCRYLVNQPSSSLDKSHKIRVAIGNGLRANVWTEFSKRFNIKTIEFYAASEGNCTMVNIRGKIGCCGFAPVLNRFFHFLPFNVIRIDDNMVPIRDKNGFCIPCRPLEKGLLVGTIGNTAKTAYNGYANNKQASENKIINNLFYKGQKAFNSGDLMMTDEYGWMYFCDRLGDTYRWRGENVSTIEVENIISSKLDSTEVNVYGVEIPGQEGRAGMATISKSNIDINTLGLNIKKDLAAFARPVFVRLNDHVEHTGSFKAKKNLLVDEGYNVTKLSDKLFYFDQKEQNYIPLTKTVYENIIKGNIKL